MDFFHNNEIKIPLIDKLYLLYKKTHQLIKIFPKSEKYSLGIKLENIILDLITAIFSANQLPNPLKENQLLKIISLNDTLKLLFRLAYENKIIDTKNYLNCEAILQETGKMLGGWIKYLKSTR